jgi:hypothetical protein
MSRLLALLLACCFTLPLVGCNDKEDPTGPESPGIVEPVTPDNLVANFKTAYDAMDLASYRDDVLAAGYRFLLQAETVEEYGLPDSTLSRADEVAVAGAMFTGQANNDGQILSAVEIQAFQPQGAWMSVPPDDPNFGDVTGAKVRTYSVLVNFSLQGDTRYEVSGLQLIYVVPDTVTTDGTPIIRFRLLGQLDLTGDGPKGVDSLSWSDVKALWY